MKGLLFLHYLILTQLAVAYPRYPWVVESSAETIEQRISPPSGYSRVPVDAESFGAWLRGLPLFPGRPLVHLYNGSKKWNQSAQFAVIQIDVGDQDLQQCADAVIRLRAEYLRASEREDAIAFHFTSGDNAKWQNWREGDRPTVHGSQVSWSRKSSSDSSYKNFRAYLDQVFMFAGSLSLSKELQSVADPAQVEVGDVFIHGGSPGHAVVVVDVAEDSAGHRIFVIAQSYMPAQEVHILRNPALTDSPWYAAKSNGILETPEWTFQYAELKRFKD